MQKIADRKMPLVSMFFSDCLFDTFAFNSLLYIFIVVIVLLGSVASPLVFSNLNVKYGILTTNASAVGYI